MSCEYHISDVSAGLPVEMCPRVTKKIMISLSSIRDRVVDTAVLTVQWVCVVTLLYVVVVLHNRSADSET